MPATSKVNAAQITHINFDYCFRGSAIAKIVGENAQQHSDLFDRQIRMWVYQEKVDGRNITDIINEKHENTK
jgi:hypothetical protein